MGSGALATVRGLIVPLLKSPGRSRLDLSEEDQELILRYYRKYRLDPITVSRKILRDQQIEIPKNTIWRVLKAGKIVVNTPAKQRQRKWVRWERDHTNSLWQTDYTQIGGEWLIAYLDDASRFITGWAVAGNAPAELAWQTFAAAGRPMDSPGNCSPKTVLSSRRCNMESRAISTGSSEDSNRDMGSRSSTSLDDGIIPEPRARSNVCSVR